MAERLSIISERVDDIPLLLAQLEQMGVRPLLDVYFPAHGHWVGLSLGWVAEVWLTRILVGSGPSAAPCRTLGGAAAPHPVWGAPGSRSIPWTWATTVWRGSWRRCVRMIAGRRVKGALNRQLRRVYDLQPACVRLDCRRPVAIEL
jgi:hypothetical protein